MRAACFVVEFFLRPKTIKDITICMLNFAYFVDDLEKIYCSVAIKCPTY